MRKIDRELDTIRQNAQQTEKTLQTKRRERAQKTGNPASLNERLIAPILLLITLLVSYLILLFS
ncbi:MAG: hypothetical protein UX28_C0001G0092 [Candidatus Pacebacteria bacterium GW2011_GWA1_46_10]|nr:MAG: hypothetical protein UX28_C0001G0092 [Candidatus Pacebacteria bacterium GW2011_GWA1_46_10]